MNDKPALISAVKSVVQIVQNLDEARFLYEECLGLKCLRETDIRTNEIMKYFGIREDNFRFARFVREGENFGCVDLIENPKADKPIRDKSRAFDYGIMTLNFRTNDIEKAVPKLQEAGCEAVSDILEYNVGKPMRELMMNTPSGERLTILEVGGAKDDLPVFNEAVATIGLVVPQMAEAKSFYEDGLGLKTAISFQASGSPFDSLLGVKHLNKLDFATLTSNGNWTGKIELLELETDDFAVDTNNLANFDSTGYLCLRFETQDINMVKERFKYVGSEIVFTTTSSKTLFVRPKSGELLEISEI